LADSQLVPLFERGMKRRPIAMMGEDEILEEKALGGR
jgi:hypothetical protein